MYPLNMANHESGTREIPFDWREHLIVDPEVMTGKPVIKGTRLTADFLFGLLGSGWTVEELLENYPKLTRESVRALFVFASELAQEESLYLVPVQAHVS